VPRDRNPARVCGLDNTSIFDHASAKTCEGSQHRSGAPMGLARGPFKALN